MTCNTTNDDEDGDMGDMDRVTCAGGMGEKEKGVPLLPMPHLCMMCLECLLGVDCNITCCK